MTRTTAQRTAGTRVIVSLLALTATLALWLVVTVRHALTPPGVPGGSRDTHEVIHPEKAGD